ncbi:hypothetical protein [Kistimonas asteriae]|uniref:hypothetical protein n=1 Tax=Kistimonas asteriae TaxID=517724 RepID=UPI001BA65B2E|nr:hypothetical protein [Kistimonas asteriae]
MEASQFSPSGGQKSRSGNNDQTVPTSTADSPKVVSDPSPLLAAGTATTRRRHPAETSLTENVRVVESGLQSSIQSWRQPSDSSALSNSDTEEDDILQELEAVMWNQSEMGAQRQMSPEPVVFSDNFSKLDLGSGESVRPGARLLGESEQSTFGESEASAFSRLLSQSGQWASTSTAKTSDISSTSGSDLMARSEQQPKIAEWSIRTDDELPNVRVEPESISPLMSESSTAHEFLEVEEPEFRSLPTYHDDNYPRQPFFADKSMRSEEKQQAEGKEAHKGAALIAQPLLRSPSFQVQRSISADDSNIAGESSQAKGKRKRRADHSVSSGEYQSLPIDLNAGELERSTRKPKRVRSGETFLSPEKKNKSQKEFESL